MREVPRPLPPGDVALGAEVDRELLRALGLGDRAVLVEDDRLEGGELGVGLGLELVGPGVPGERPAAVGADWRAGEEEEEAVAAREALVERHGERQVEGAGRRLALDLLARRGVALDRCLRLLDDDVERDPRPVVADLVLGAERLPTVAEDPRVDPREVAEFEILDASGPAEQAQS